MHVTPSGIRSSPEKPSYANAYAPIVFSVDGSVRVPVILPCAGEPLYLLLEQNAPSAISVTPSGMVRPPGEGAIGKCAFADRPQALSKRQSAV